MDPNQQPPIQQPPMPQQPVNEIPKSGSKLKWILLIIILLLIVCGGTYYLGVKQNKSIVQKQITPTITQASPSPIPESNVNWKIYEVNGDKSGIGTPGFSIKYPDGWTADAKNMAASAGVLSSNDHKYTIFLNNDPPFPFNLAKVKPDNVIDIPTGTINLFSNTTGTGEYAETTITAFASYNNYYYSFELGGFVQDIKQFEPTFHQMLQTLVFNKSNPIIDTSTWQQYTNTQNMFSLKIPKSISIYANQSPIRAEAGPAGLYFSVVSNPDNLSAYNFAKKDIQKDIDITGDIIPSPPNFSGLDAVIIGGRPSGQGLGPIAYISRKSSIIIIYFVGIDGRNTANAVLSTFKFTQ